MKLLVIEILPSIVSTMGTQFLLYVRHFPSSITASQEYLIFYQLNASTHPCVVLED